MTRFFVMAATALVVSFTVVAAHEIVRTRTERVETAAAEALRLQQQARELTDSLYAVFRVNTHLRDSIRTLHVLHNRQLLDGCREVWTLQ